MSLQPIIPPSPVSPEATSFRASDERACNRSIGSHPTQKDEGGGTEKLADDLEVLSSEDEFPDGGLRAWAVVLGVGLCLSRKISY
jgi:hypothetical protein